LRRLTLREYRTERGVELTVLQREAIRQLHPGISIQPTAYSTDRYDLTPDHRIGLVETADLVLEIVPKIPMASVLFLLAYACDAADWFDEQPEYGEDSKLTALIAVMLARLVERATRRGLLNGYQVEEEALQSPRGQILFGEQIRRHLGDAPPVEVRHDVYTPDILENRVLTAALATLARMPLGSQVAGRELARAQGLFGGVRRLRFSPSRIPEVQFTRLNRHYQSAVELATLVLRSASLDLGSGGARGSALLIDMNVVFEEFVRKALRRSLAVDPAAMPDRQAGLRLDEDGRVPLRPDLALVVEGTVTWIGDAKYKRLPAGAYTNADLYQLLAYSVALGLPGGMLIYAADEGVDTAEHIVLRGGQRLSVVALDLSAPRSALLEQVQSIANSITKSGAVPGAQRLGSVMPDLALAFQ
jgi:5-methylcytosine-specific restriction enzyme subunit McrC